MAKGKPTRTRVQALRDRHTVPVERREGEWIGAGVFARSLGPLVQILDPKTSRKLLYTQIEFTSFIDAVKAGAFDSLIIEPLTEGDISDDADTTGDIQEADTGGGAGDPGQETGKARRARPEKQELPS